ncbi:hypothetical protein ABZ807_07635 [Micromonospora sp. NPDC047548]|uniref:hypothetical protein n=1 Tax=Micromonospora sp. NPDC047548 TaxID=3155624 RepID=UPI0034018296
MSDLDDFRKAMRAETANLSLHITPDGIRRRARGIRATRLGTATAAVALAASALAVPGYMLVGNEQGGQLQAGSLPTLSSPACPTPSLGEGASLPSSTVETGINIEGPDRKQFTVVLALTGNPDDVLFTIAFRDKQTGYTVPWDMVGISRGPGESFSAKGKTWHFQTGQLPLEAGRVVDVGIYSGVASRITVASEGRSSDAHLTQAAVNDWTFFWAVRSAKPLPPEANNGPKEYVGPERLTITAYDSTGRIKHTVTGGFHTGNRVQNPRDNSGEPHATPTPGVLCS